MGPRLDQEPDPATTGDTASPGAPGAEGEPGVECPLAGVLQQVLEQDPAVQASLERIPPRNRSVAGAVMLWNGRWIEPELIGGAATINSVQAAVAMSLDAASETCRTQVISGPVFLPLESRSGTLVVALGSGHWRWADLLTTASAPDRRPLPLQPMR